MEPRTYLPNRARIVRVACAAVMLAGCSNAAQIAPTPGRTDSAVTSAPKQIREQ